MSKKQQPQNSQEPTIGSWIFEGTLTTQSPLVTSKPMVGYAKRASDTPAELPRMAIYTDAGLEETIYYPGCGIRGRLRRCARDLIRERIIEQSGNPTPFSLMTHYYLTLGGIKDSEPENRFDVVRSERLRALNPMVSLFGASAPWMSSKLITGHAIPSYPLSQAITISGVRSNDFVRNPGQIQYLPTEDVDLLLEEALLNQQRSRLKQELTQLNKKLRQLKKASTKTPEEPNPEQPPLKERKEEITKEIEEINQKSQFTVSVGLPLAGYEAIPQGTQLAQRFILQQVTATELSLFLQALDRFALHPILGGQTSTGNGLVSGHWMVRHQTPNSPASSDGEIHLTPFEGIQITSPTLKQHYGTFNRLDNYDFSTPKEIDP